MWNNWEQLRRVAHWSLVVGITIALLFSLGTCIVQIQNVRVNFPCTKRLFNLSAEAIIKSAMHVSVIGAQYSFWRTKNFLFPVVWSRGLHFWRESKMNSRCCCRGLLSWQILFQRRELRISWRLCNNFEVHLWFWKLWSLVVCSQSSFYVTRACKGDKNRQNPLFLC